MVDHRVNISNNKTYEPLLDSPSTPRSNGRNQTKLILVALCGLLMVGFLLASIDCNGGFSGFIARTDDDEYDASLPLFQERPISYLTTPHVPMSRGVSAGVSEKSNKKLLGSTASFPWNNSMLSWQRTAFHFQPEKNWMNGICLSSIINFNFLFVFKKVP